MQRTISMPCSGTQRHMPKGEPEVCERLGLGTQAWPTRVRAGVRAREKGGYGVSKTIMLIRFCTEVWQIGQCINAGAQPSHTQRWQHGENTTCLGAFKQMRHSRASGLVWA